MTFGSACLANPADFPAELAGDPWGTEDLFFDLPGGPYYFLGLSLAQARSLARVFGDTCCPAATAATTDVPGVTTVLLSAERDRFLAFDRIDWKILIDIDYQPKGVRLAAHQWMGLIDWNRGHRGAIWTPVEDGAAFTDLFENYFRILVAYRLLHLGGLLLHSAGVAGGTPGRATPGRATPGRATPGRATPGRATPGRATPGRAAFVFPGRSGNGKSTLSKICDREGHTVLSDDGNAVLPEPSADSGYVVEALPFGGEMRDRDRPTGAFSLRRVVALAKGSPNRLESLGRAQATGLLLACSPFVNGDPFRLGALLTAIEKLLSKVPGRRLTFTREGGFWTLLEDDHLTAEETEGDPA